MVNECEVYLEIYLELGTGIKGKDVYGSGFTQTCCKKM